MNKKKIAVAGAVTAFVGALGIPLALGLMLAQDSATGFDVSHPAAWAPFSIPLLLVAGGVVMMLVGRRPRR